MNDLLKTTTIPDGNAESVISKPILKMIVLGNYPDTVKKADNYAIFPPAGGIDRQVIWFKSPTDSNIKTLFPDFDKSVNDVQAFSVSPINKIADYILNGEVADNTRVDHCYTIAGKPEFN